jgi:hypothetical protein
MNGSAAAGCRRRRFAVSPVCVRERKRRNSARDGFIACGARAVLLFWHLPVAGGVFLL